jgi:hypothetical protein
MASGKLPISITERPTDPATEVTVDDVVCCDCGGRVTLFAVPDSVWDGLGYPPDAWACFECVGKRLNPELKSEEVRQWIGGRSGSNVTSSIWRIGSGTRR